MVIVACAVSATMPFAKIALLSYHYTEQKPELSKLSSKHAPTLFDVLACTHLGEWLPRTEFYEQIGVDRRMDNGEYRTSSGNVTVINVESLVR